MLRTASIGIDTSKLLLGVLMLMYEQPPSGPLPFAPSTAKLVLCAWTVPDHLGVFHCERLHRYRPVRLRAGRPGRPGLRACSESLGGSAADAPAPRTRAQPGRPFLEQHAPPHSATSYRRDAL